MSATPRPGRISFRNPLGRLALCALLTWGASSPAAAASTPYRVESGDTLRKIALRFYGSKVYWKRLYQANRKAIGQNPDLIHTGTTLTLPVIPGVSRAAVPKLETRVPPPPRLPEALPSLEPAIVPVEPVVVSTPEPVLVEPSPEPLAIATVSLPVTQGRHSPYWLAAASLVVPGSGQVIRGDWERGLSHLGLTALSLSAFQLGSRNADPGLQWAGGLGLVGISLWSAWDAYRQPESVIQP